MQEPTTRNGPPARDLQNAFCLGWIVAEIFGRLRDFQPPRERRRAREGSLARFSYSTSDLSDADWLAVNERQIKELGRALRLPMPPLPSLADVAHAGALPTTDGHELRRIHGILETWSRDASVQLAGRSYTLG